MNPLVFRNLVLGALTLAVAIVFSGCSKGEDADATGISASTESSPYDIGPRAAESPIDEALATQGETLFKSKTCSTCHGFGKRITGPDLMGVTARRTEAWMTQQILHPDVMTKSDPISRELLGKYAVQMPNLMLRPDEAKALIEFLKKKNSTAAATAP